MCNTLLLNLLFNFGHNNAINLDYYYNTNMLQTWYFWHLGRLPFNDEENQILFPPEVLFCSFCHYHYHEAFSSDPERANTQDEV